IQALGLFSVYICAFILGAGGQYRLVLTMVGSAAAIVSLISLAHMIFAADAVYGLYKPVHARPTVLSPLLNSNHLAGLSLLGVPILATLGLEGRDPYRYAYGTAAILTASTLLLTLSRGGIVSFAVTSVITVVWVSVLRRRQGRKSSAVGLMFVLLAGAGLGIWAARGLKEEFADASQKKLELLLKSFEFMQSCPWVGVGRGGYSAAFVEFYGNDHRAHYAENLIAQWISEWGAIVGPAVLLSCAITYVLAARNARNAVQVGALTGLGGLVLQNMVDFSLELSGVATAGAATLGVVTSFARKKLPRLRIAPLRTHRVARLVGTLSLGIILFFGWSVHRDSLVTAQDRLEKSLATPELFQDELRRAVQKHPSEPVLALLAGHEARRRNDPMALRWLSRAMVLAPNWSSPHEEAAYALFARGAVEQALISLREALERDPSIKSTLPCEVLNLRSRADPTLDLLQAARGRAASRMLELAAVCLAIDADETRRLDQKILSLDQDHAPANLRAARRARRNGDSVEALDKIFRAVRSDPSSRTAHLLRLELLLASQQYLAAAQAVEYAQKHLDSVWELKAMLAVAKGDVEAMRSAISAMRGSASESASRLARTYRFLGKMELKMGYQARAMAAYTRAYRIARDSQSLDKVANLAEQLGDRATLRWALKRLCTQDSTPPRACSGRSPDDSIKPRFPRAVVLSGSSN
ncbi:MAG: O-antigen ligase family protein, partial [Myxococcota bacterium]